MKPFLEFAFDYLEQLQHALDHTNLQKVEEAVNLIRSCKGTVWLIGNGGSAALASHMATDLQLAGVRAVALTDISAITTYGNDKDFDEVFREQLLRLGSIGDVLIAISGSGNSPNIVRCVAYNRDDMKVIAVTGGVNQTSPGGALGHLAHLHLHIPSTHMGVAQDGHQTVLHLITYFLMGERNASNKGK